MTYAEVLTYLNSLSRFGWRMGLERMDALCERLGHPERTFDIVHIAGTNGKGSTATYLAAILQAAGRLTGLYTSPHLYDGRERIQVDGDPISQDEVVELVELLGPHIQKVEHQHGPVTEFEAWTMVMFLHFERRKVRTAVIEAGLGGRWDSTNIAPSQLAVLTNVSLDHTDRLGKTIKEIARDKAGILKSGGKALLGPLPPDARQEVETEARLVRARLYSLLSRRDPPISGDPQWQFHYELAEGGSFFLVQPGDQSDLFTHSGPRYQGRNAALAAAAASILAQDNGYEIPPEAIRTGLSVPIPGRFEVLTGEPEIILDGAHNPAAAAVLAAELTRGWINAPALPGPGGIAPCPQLRLVFGGSAGHDVEGCLRILAPLAREVILTRAHNPRSVDPEGLAEVLRGLGIPFEIVPDVATAVSTAVRRSRPCDRVCVTGSFFVLGEAPRRGGSR